MSGAPGGRDGQHSQSQNNLPKQERIRHITNTAGKSEDDYVSYDEIEEVDTDLYAKKYSPENSRGNKVSFRPNTAGFKLSKDRLATGETNSNEFENRKDRLAEDLYVLQNKRVYHGKDYTKDSHPGRGSTTARSINDFTADEKPLINRENWFNSFDENTTDFEISNPNRQPDPISKRNPPKYQKGPYKSMRSNKTADAQQIANYQGSAFFEMRKYKSNLSPQKNIVGKNNIQKLDGWDPTEDEDFAKNEIDRF